MKLSFFDPQNDPRLIEYLRTKAIANGVLPFNFYSIINLGIRLDNLYPSQEIIEFLKEEMDGDGNSYVFDKAYCGQILSNEKSFVDLMRMMSQIMVYPEINVMSNYTNPIIMPILDSLMKLIQERYGINSFIINDLDDIDELKTSEFDSLEQQAIFTKDCERFVKITKIPIVTASQAEIDEDQKSLIESIENAFDTALSSYDVQRYGLL